MKSAEKCLERANAYKCSQEKAAEILRRNSRPKEVSEVNPGNFLFVSGAELYTNPFFGGIKNLIAQDGDTSIYWTTDSGIALGITSFNISPENEEFEIVQIQSRKAKRAGFKRLGGIEQKAIRTLHWEESLIEVVESIAKLCDASSVSIVSADKLRELRGLKGRHLAGKYDVPAIYRGYLPDEKGYYRKEI